MPIRRIIIIMLVFLIVSLFGCATKNWQYKYPDPAKFDGYEWYAPAGPGFATIEPSTGH